MKKKKRLRKVGIALLVVCGLAAFANSFSDHNKTPANNTPSIASYSLSVDDSAAAPAFADVYASAGQTASSSIALLTKAVTPLQQVYNRHRR